MSTDQKQTTAVGSVLALACAGSGQNYGTARKMAMRSGNKYHNIPKKYIKDSVNLNGVDADIATMTKWIRNINNLGGQQYYKSAQSISSSQLTVYMAKKSIINWLKENIDEYVFYFTGHGSINGICFKDGILSYNELAKLLTSTSKQVSILIDACHSGAIVDAFKLIKSKMDVLLLFSCQKNEVSADIGINGGYWTQIAFGPIKRQYGDFNSVPAIEHYYPLNGTTSKQTPGNACFIRK